jgi:hypothetical protein
VEGQFQIPVGFPMLIHNSIDRDGEDVTVRRIGDREAIFGPRPVNSKISVKSNAGSWYVPKGGAVPDMVDRTKDQPDHWLVGALGVGSTGYRGLGQGREWDDDGVWDAAEYERMDTGANGRRGNPLTAQSAYLVPSLWLVLTRRQILKSTLHSPLIRANCPRRRATDLSRQWRKDMSILPFLNLPATNLRSRSMVPPFEDRCRSTSWMSLLLPANSIHIARLGDQS